jgi:hypothetical protein
MGDTNITISGNADKDTVAALRTELDRRDQEIKRQIPFLAAQGKRDRLVPKAA